MLQTPLGRLRAVGYAEGTSFLVLLGVAMPLKYLAGLPEAVLVAGWVHGVLFVLYVLAVAQAASVLRWGRPRVLAALLASVLPFGPFVFDARLRKDESAGAEPGPAADRG